MGFRKRCTFIACGNAAGVFSGRSGNLSFPSVLVSGKRVNP